MPTIRDVAARAGVSPSTVSHILNGTRHVEPATRGRVLAAIEALAYRPNGLARGLRRHETRTIGLLVPDNSNPFFAELARAIEDAGFAEGYSVVLCNSDQSETKEAAYVEVLLSKQVDGVILVSGSSQPDILRRILASGVPVVVLPGALSDLPADHVLSDDVAGGYQVGAYLASLGHRCIGCIAGPRLGTSSSGRIEGFRQALADADIDLDEAAIVRSDFRVGGGEAGMDALLARDLRLTAVFAGNDLMALGALGALRRAGRRVPDDVSVVGFDGIWFGSAITPALTTIAQPIAALSRTSVRLLLERMRDGALAPRRVLLPTTLIERESCRVWRERKEDAGVDTGVAAAASRRHAAGATIAP